MGMPNSETILFPSTDNQVTAAAGSGRVVNASDLAMGYDYTHDAASAYTASLQGSVSGQNWTDIATLTASGQGAIPSHYTMVRINCTVAGAIGTSLLKYRGKS